jgi:hypothetical protein
VFVTPAETTALLTRRSASMPSVGQRRIRDRAMQVDAALADATRNTAPPPVAEPDSFNWASGPKRDGAIPASISRQPAPESAHTSNAGVASPLVSPVPGGDGFTPMLERPAPPATMPAHEAEADMGVPRILASAVYVTGSSALEPGRRYAIAVHGSRLRFLGPIDADPSAVVVDRPIAGAEATAVEGRLVISVPERRSVMVAAFMSVAGRTPDAVARAIVDAARASSGLH